MRHTVWAIAALLVGAGQSWADDFDIRTGQQLLDNCQSAEPRAVSSCRNYVSGALEAILMIQAQTFVCHFVPPDQWTEEQAIGTAVDYLEAHPDERAEAGAKTILDAMAATYPCPK